MTLEELTKAAWKEITDGVPQDVINVERGGLESYAFALAVYRDAEARVRKEGLVVADEKGRPQPHPALKIQRDESRDVDHWLGVYRRIRKRK